jgi:hypothetical protein
VAVAEVGPEKPEGRYSDLDNELVVVEVPVVVPVDVLAVIYSSVVDVSLMSVVPDLLSPNSLED